MAGKIRPIPLGVVAAVLIAIGSFGAGATRYRDGLMRSIGLEFLTYGHGRGMMDGLLMAGTGLLVFAWLWLWRTRPGEQTVLRAVWSWAAPLALSAPIMSRDVYSYLMQGAMLRDGFDPYSEGAAINPGPYLWEVSHDWRNTTTPYGPLHLGIGKAVTTIVGDHVAFGVVAYRLIALAGFALIVWSVPRIARLAGASPGFALWVGVANPVMLLHLIGGMHNEAVMVGLVCAGLYLCMRHSWCTPGIVLIACAVSLKATAAFALPFVVWLMVTRRARVHDVPHHLAALAVSGAWALAVSVAVIQVVTWVCGSTWGWLEEITGNSKVINPLAGPTFAAELITPLVQLVNDDFSYNTTLAATRTVFSFAMLLALVITWWWFRPARGKAYAPRMLAGTTVAYTAAFVTNAVTLPWYYASILALVGTFRAPAWVARITTGASVVVALAFTGSGNHRLYDVWFLAAAFIVAVVATRWVFRTPSLAHDE